MRETFPHFCHVPWKAVYMHPDGTIRPCCVSRDRIGSTNDGDSVESVWNSEALKKIRKTFLQGEVPQGCQHCISREKVSGSSQRTLFHREFSEHLSVIENLSEEAPFEILKIDFTFSSLCNLRCRFCHPTVSSRWVEDGLALAEIEGFEHYGQSNKINHTAKDLQHLVEQSPGLKRIEFKGGEPFLNPEFISSLNFLVTSGRASQLDLKISTNATILNPKIKTLLSKFARVELTVSIEGIGDTYRYVRGEQYGIENVEKFLRLYDGIENIFLSANIALSVYSIFEPHRIQEWLIALDLESPVVLAFGMVNSPTFLNPMILPQPFRKKVAEQLGRSPHKVIQNIAAFLGNDHPTSDAIFDQFVRFTNQLDKTRGVSLLDTIPQMAEIFPDPR